MTKSTRRTYPEDFKRKAVKLVLEEGHKVFEVARNLGVDRRTLDRWRQQLGEEAVAPSVRTHEKKVEPRRRGAEVKRESGPVETVDGFYRAFEDRYRGSRELIKSRLRVYLAFVEPLKAIHEDCRALDLGCGRGEWLELMRESGIDASGIDLDEGMLMACREMDLPAERAEAVTYLRALPDDSMAIVSAFHVAEHIPFHALQTLVRESLRVLAPAGLLILETPNPENLSVGTSRFYYDPSHEKPIPPPLLSFLLEHYGFARTKVLRLQEPPGLPQAAEINLADVLLGVSPDYAVVGQKDSVERNHLALFDVAFSADYGIDLDHLALRYDQSVGSKLTEILTRIDRAAEFESRATAALEQLVQTQGRLAEAEGQLVQTQGRLAEAEGQLVQTQGRLGANEAHVSRAQEQLQHTRNLLSEREQQLAAMYGSTSWRLTGPLRAAVIGLRHVIETLPARATLAAKIRLKPHFVRAGGYLEDRPALKAKIFRVMQSFPRLRSRLARAARPMPLAAEAAARQEDGSPTPAVADLTASARRVYQDLLDARAAAAKRARTR
jgi:transposase-like protein